MDSSAPLPHRHNSPKYHIDTEPPFARSFTPVSPSQTSFPSTASLLSPISPIRSQHRYCLINGKGKGNDRPWLSLLLNSRSPKPEYLPMFIGKDPISGTVELELTKPENIREVIVTLKGEKTHFTEEPHTFLEMSCTLLRQPSGKLSGRHSYPFSFILPDEVTIDESNWVMVYPVPPKFHERGIVYIDYKIVVTVRRGLFSVDNSLMKNLVYLPETIAERPSALREQAYLDERPMPLPMLDPGGWKFLPPIEAVDTLVPNVTVTAQLSIANPLSFSVGTPIPLFLNLRNNEAADFSLDLIDVRLVRTLITRSVTGGERKFDVARAVFWPAPSSSPRMIKLWGEVLTGTRLTPSFNFSKCSVRYSIALYPRHSPEEVKYQSLLEEEVFLTLRNAPGVTPRSQAPPGVTPAQVERQRSMPARLFPIDFGHS